MAKKIIGGVGGLLGIGGKKKADAAPAAEAPKGPVITQLNGKQPTGKQVVRRAMGALFGKGDATILSDKLGS